MVVQGKGRKKAEGRGEMEEQVEEVEQQVKLGKRREQVKAFFVVCCQD